MSQESAKYYNDYVERQVKSGIHHRHLAIQRWLQKLKLPQKGNFLEIGCGIGTQTQLILQYLSSEANLTSIDISDRSIALAKERLKQYRNLTLIVGDITKINIHGQYDAIILPDVIEHIPINEHSHLFQKLSSLIKNDGFIFIHIPHPNYLAWITQNRPHELQIIDNPVYTDKLLGNVYKHGLFLDYLKSYSIFNNPPDYQVIVLRKMIPNSYLSIERPKADSFYRRAKRKLKLFVRGK